MSDTNPVTVLVTYKFKEGTEQRMRDMLESHWPTLEKLGLVTTTPPKFWRASGKDGKAYFLEMFEWKDDQASNIAHQTPEVMAVWEPMGAILEDIQIAHIEPLDLSIERA